MLLCQAWLVLLGLQGLPFRARSWPARGLCACCACCLLAGDLAGRKGPRQQVRAACHSLQKSAWCISSWRYVES